MPMHQEPAIGDEEVEARLALAGEHGRLWRPGRRSSSSTACSSRGTAWLSSPGPGGVNAAPFWPDVGALRRARARASRAAGFSAITHAVGDGAVRGALDAYEAAGRRGAACTGSSTSRR